MNTVGKKVKEIRTDAGKPETSEDFRIKCSEQYQIHVSPAEPRAQYKNPVERLIETVDNKKDAVIGTQPTTRELTDRCDMVLSLRDSTEELGYQQTRLSSNQEAI